MSSRRDWYNIFSAVFLLLGVGIVAVFSSEIDASDKKYSINLIGFVSSIASIVGLVIAILQLFKISASRKIQEETYNKTLAAIVSNELISQVTRALGLIALIKTLLEFNTHNSMRAHLNQLSIELISLAQSKRIEDEGVVERLRTFSKFCSDLECKIFQQTKTLNQIDLNNYYNNFFEIQETLSGIHSVLKTPPKTNYNG